MPKITAPVKLYGIDVRKSYLLLINPDQIPHLVLVIQNKYFALTYKESVLQRDFSLYFDSLKRAGKKLIFLELAKIEKNPKDVFEKYSEAGKVSCFQPIKEILIPESPSNFIFELVPELYKQGLIKKSYHLNLGAYLDDLGDFKMSIYSKAAIYSYIESLKEKHAERIKSTS